MSTKTDGGQAFPSPIAVGPAGDVYAAVQAEFGTGGMTLRDYFAAQAIAGLMLNERAYEWAAPAAADRAYRLADALLAERSKP